jgi:hypothetical protein
MKATFSCERMDEIISARTDTCYEEQAREEEIYLEEREEDVRMILEYEDSPPSSPRESPDQQRAEAAEELITGDSDDPPLSENAVAEMLKAR